MSETSKKLKLHYYWVVRKVRADVEGKLKRRRFKFYYIFIKLYRLIGTNFPDNPILTHQSVYVTNP